MKLKRKQLLPAITTTQGSNWREKIKEIDQLGLKKIAIFTTCLNKEERQEFFDLLEKTKLKEIPFVHLRSDQEPEELDYLIKRWKTKVFNMHSPREFPFKRDYKKYYQMLYIENTYASLDENEVKDFAGVCLDVSHLENDKLLHQERYKQNMAVLEKFPVGCNHISDIKPTLQLDLDGGPIYSIHSFKELSEFDYLKDYPQKYFSNYIAIELENSLKDQLKVIDYIINL